MVSALFSEQILSSRQPEDDEVIDGIIYPSVGNDYQTDNLAILPECLDKNFKLTGVAEFVIEESFYNKPFQQGDPGAIQVAKVKNVRGAKSISSDGIISW
ncbi:hypothetical protein A4D02_35605 [Niastella koreensis]|uniref:Uncharacterized protein n=2 Tax=Niastella koreensis TaxID=354356 RepID=G8TKG5_NIAKG|nr:hypothetical protein [Niastella koreensis]AEV97621.1 hypothetical protein Niako_1248 [Niastella koreensis GR20-10]OQP44206.1 hypothetical protein A4D02_35605 [Niastella koreensis]